MGIPAASYFPGAVFEQSSRMVCRACRGILFSVAGVLSIAGTASPVAAQDPVANHPRVTEALDLLDVWLESEIAYERVPGISVAVVHDQDMVWAAGWGYAHPEHRTPATSRTLYRGCSIAKLFTATAVIQMRDQGLLDLGDSVATHLPWFHVRNPSGTAEPLTIEALLTHSSGLPRDLPFAYWTGPDYPFPTREQLVAALTDLTVLYPPRTRSNYSNVGMALAGEIVAAISQEPFAEYLRQNLFGPMGMEDTSIDPPAAALGDRLATGYSVIQRDGTRGHVPPYQVRGLAPAAGLTTTAEDLARFASWQFRVLDGAADDVIEPASLREMHRIQWMEPEGWSRSGFGYQTWAENDRHFVGHAGACPGYESKVLVRAPEKIGVAVMTNAQGPNVDGYAQRIYDVLATAISAAILDSDAAASDSQGEDTFARYTGLYRRDLGGETAVVKWRGGLGLLRLPSGNPRSLEQFEHVEDGIFQLRGTSGRTADLLRFDEDENGRIQMWRHHQYSTRVQ